MDMSDVPDTLFAKQAVNALRVIIADPAARAALQRLWNARVPADGIDETTSLVLRSESGGDSLGIGGLLNGMSDLLGNGGYRIATEWSGGEGDELLGFRLVTVESVT